MKKIFLALIMLHSLLFSTEFRIGYGSYTSKFQIKDFLHHDVTHDTVAFSIKESHQALSSSPIFYFYDAEFLTSDTKKDRTYFAASMANTEFPIVGSINNNLNRAINFMPVDGEYQAIAFDLNFGAGYDLIKQKKNYLGVALNLGATLPMINADNLRSNASFAYDMMDSWDLDVSTYKIGPSITARYHLHSNLSIYLDGGLGFQKGSVKSELFKSSVDVNGAYRSFDIGVSYQLNNSSYLRNKLYFTLGHSYKSWRVDSVNVNLFNFFQANIFRPFDMDLTSHQTYLGMGYRF